MSLPAAFTRSSKSARVSALGAMRKASRGFSEQTKLHEKIQRDDDAT
jgi:hypothetical protein